MKPDTVVDLVKENLLPQFLNEQKNLEKIDGYLHNRQSTTKLPRRSGKEHKHLASISKTPWLRLVVNAAAQMLYAESVYSTSGDVERIWKPWERNQFQSRQLPLYRDAIGYGTAYSVGLPGTNGKAHLRPYSPLEMFAVYSDPAEDEWPAFAIRAIQQANETLAVRVIDEEAVHFLASSKEDGIEFIESRSHGLGVCPVVRYSPRLDLLGRAEGDVEPYMTVSDRLDKTEYDRLLAQHYNSWRVKTATKLDEDISPEDTEKIRMQLSHEDILLGAGDTEFGNLDVTPLADLNTSKESHVETLAAISQTATTALSGKMINVSADGLAEAKANAYAKRDEFKTALGGSHTQLLRLAAHIEGRRDDAEDYSLSISWADTETRTLNQAVDALGKAATMLGVPAELLWELIPGISHTQAEDWKRYARENPSGEFAELETFLRQMEPNDGVEQ